VNGLRVHLAPTLQLSSTADPGVDRYFGEVLRPTLQVRPSVLDRARASSGGTTSTCTKASPLRRQGRYDPLDRDLGCDVFPDAHDRPTGFAERVVHSTVPGDVGRELRHPVVPVALGHVLVVWAAVPEAAIDEHRHPPRGEHDIRVDPDITSPKEQVLSEPEATTVQARAQADLWLGAGPAVGLADLRRSGVRGLRVGHDLATTQVDRPSPPALRRIIASTPSAPVPCHRASVYWSHVLSHP